MSGVKKKQMHGFRNTLLYKRWIGMRNRCNNKNGQNYNRYGGRGIKVCKQWDKYVNFHKWAMENGYRDDLTIDRKDNNGNYTPSNCRWVTRKVQGENRNITRKLTIGNKTLTVEHVSNILGINTQKARRKMAIISGEIRPIHLDEPSVLAAIDAVQSGYSIHEVARYLKRPAKSIGIYMKNHSSRLSKQTP